MKITVLNGSPKGDLSVTMQYVHYLAKALPEHDWEIVNVAQRVRHLERDDQAFDELIAGIAASDAVLWAFPLYYMLVHGNYKRFIELIWERDVTAAFRDKYTASLSTSIHFFDHTAHNYIHAIADDLGMHLTDAFSAHMQDLFSEEKRRALVAFGRSLVDAVEGQAPVPRRYAPLTWPAINYMPGPAPDPVSTADQRVVIVTDAEANGTNLPRMIERFASAFAEPVEVINLHDVDIKGGCLGCLRCGWDNTCAYEGKDDYTSMHRERLQTADVLVFAGAMRDRYLSSTWKTFFDRSFFMTHTPSLVGKQFGFIIAGPLGRNENLQQILESWVELQQSHLVGIVTDEYDDSADIDGLLDALAAKLVRSAERDYQKPQTFLGVGGTKLFRDDVWGNLRTVFRADHRAYRRMGIYDFPQRDLRTRAVNAVTGLLFRIPKVRQVFTDRIKEGMVQPYRRILEEADDPGAD